MINIQFYQGLGDKTIKFIDSGSLPDKNVNESDCHNLFLLLGMGLQWRSFDLFCEKLNLTPEQKDNLRRLNHKALQNYKEEKEVGWEG